MTTNGRITITVADWIAFPYVATKLSYKQKAMKRLNNFEKFIVAKGLEKEFEEWCVCNE